MNINEKANTIIVYYSQQDYVLIVLEFVFPPELKWWLDEARKLNNSINLDYCFLNRDEDYEYVDINIDTKQLNPMLMKWDYDGSRFSYYSICSMIKIGDTGEYFLSNRIKKHYQYN